MGFSRQDYWSGLPLPSPFLLSHFPDLRIEDDPLQWATVTTERQNAGALGTLPDTGCTVTVAAVAATYRKPSPWLTLAKQKYTSCSYAKTSMFQN